MAAPCRALRVTGSAQRVGGEPLVTSNALDGKAWLELGADASVAVRHGASSREFELRGPGRFLPCRAGLEQVLIAEGVFESSPGAGVRPGAEMWVATPFAALHYGDANLSVRVGQKELLARVVNGRVVSEAELAPGTQALAVPKEKRWTHLLAPNERAERCDSAAHTARGSADELMRASSDLGKLAAAQLEQRRRARAECLIAETALARLSDTAEKGRLSDQVERANQLWQAIPAMLR